jgi:hypothetical protein
MNTAPRRSARIAAAPTRWWFPSHNSYTTAPGGRTRFAANPAASSPRLPGRRAKGAELAAARAWLAASAARSKALLQLRWQVAHEAADEGYARLHYADEAEEDAVW